MRWLVPLLKLLYSPFLAAVCLAAGTAAWFFISLGLGLGGRLGLMITLPGLFFGLTVVQVVWSARVLLLPRPAQTDEFEPPAKSLAGLVKLTRRIAGERRLPAPDVIRLSPDDVAYVYEDDRNRKVLVVGAVALGIFSQPQFASVIAHELGHFAGGDTRTSRRGYRWSLMMGVLDFEFDRNPWAAANPLVWLVRGYHLLYRWALAANSRVQEYRADRCSVEHAGKREAAVTLILFEAIEKLPWARLSAIADAAVQLSIPVDRIFTEQAKRAAEITPADWQEACARALRSKTRPFDTHPALRDRLRAIGVSRKKALELASQLDHSGPKARDLVTGWDSIEHWLTATLLEQHRERWEAKQEAAAIILGRPAVGR
ncbi:MAG TPA: M48 family metalloprotease [Planctomycetaceae bacterium]|nr:M48 family metalloprotease [Planctomycetaceae bacterium]